jgi:hypothetical protein
MEDNGSSFAINKAKSNESRDLHDWISAISNNNIGIRSFSSNNR